jgi:hypothetical protein
MGIAIQGTVEGLQTRKDRTLKITIGSQELKGKQMAELMDLNQSLVYVYISPKAVTKQEKDLIDGVEIDAPVNVKSASQRLRNVFYRIWSNNATGVDKFEDYYKQRMESVIDFYKEKIDAE